MPKIAYLILVSACLLYLYSKDCSLQFLPLLRFGKVVIHATISVFQKYRCHFWQYYAVCHLISFHVMSWKGLKMFRMLLPASWSLAPIDTNTSLQFCPIYTDFLFRSALNVSKRPLASPSRLYTNIPLPIFKIYYFATPSQELSVRGPGRNFYLPIFLAWPMKSRLDGSNINKWKWTLLSFSRK